ncbi:ribosome small subunit-dependent GTPase A [Candidatus Lucifugimonas marina]|uniref:Small ribosomal subunit biogenesis GTPase RsgA n=1 Tax=Candidatus Lucifugimonas marina TaxID=3038979 RepID=A0AAJ5ZD65_9CHLR|nr:ribosome small subunit-dependent GTPase A [SAR202 cluster bacterium JH702]MDG0868484.1 ribosome small subunit-dependent GTPase A [SAR202 cluster bacterium JH639]WFG35117.1 ribosome small subunit-dependent GTPase A [SAR202 cluster bacterium JH545]WFG39073.1 ribosome small subunit-dependent GTPase A [SAR202 cluster bacterium JH1073]
MGKLQGTPTLNSSPQNDNLDQPVAELANLVQYGLTESVAARFASITSKDSDLVPGRVARVDGISTFVHADSVDYRAVSTYARIAHDDEFEIEPAQPTVGDWVLIRPGQNQDPDEIELVLPRSSLLARKRVQRGKEEGDEQVLAANISTVFVVQAATYFNPGRLEREIALVWGSGATPVVVISKTDLLMEDNDAPTEEEVIEQARSSAPGVEVFAVSGITGAGTDPLREYTIAGSTVVLIGASGVGKSTLVNQLMGHEAMETGDIRESDTRGRHTTVTRQLLPLPNGGVLIDTPGIRSIALVSGSEEALAKTFSEVEQYLGQCRFRDCGHNGEPGCAIGKAIKKGELSADRFESYKRMGRELEYEETKHNPAVKTEHQRRMKVIAKNNRQRSRSGKRKNS